MVYVRTYAQMLGSTQLQSYVNFEKRLFFIFRKRFRTIILRPVL